MAAVAAARWFPEDPNLDRLLVGDAKSSPTGSDCYVHVYVDKVGGTLGVYTLLSKGDRKWQARFDTPWRDPTGIPVAYGTEDLHHWVPADINGDGRLDLIHLYFLGPGVRVEYLISNGDGTWSAARTIISYKQHRGHCRSIR